MPCYHPVPSWRTRDGEIVFRELADSERLELPCGRCIGCRLERKRQWAVRIMHEARLHSENCFLTLTYDPAHLPANGTLVPEHLVLFFKRLRRRYPGKRIRYFAVGEYGERLSRPHYHVCLFGHEFPDRVFWTRRGRHVVLKSATLDELWGKGLCEIGALTPDSASYCGGYVVKKMNGQLAASHYERVDLETGEFFMLEPEFARMSRRPGLGQDWVLKYGNDCFPHGRVVVKGREAAVPAYYLKLYSELAPDEAEELKAERAAAARRNFPETTERRLADREVVARARLALKKRSLESDT